MLKEHFYRDLLYTFRKFSRCLLAVFKFADTLMRIANAMCVKRKCIYVHTWYRMASSPTAATTIACGKFMTLSFKPATAQPHKILQYFFLFCAFTEEISRTPCKSPCIAMWQETTSWLTTLFSLFAGGPWSRWTCRPGPSKKRCKGIVLISE